MTQTFQQHFETDDVIQMNNKGLRHYRFRIQLSQQQYLNYYRGAAPMIQVISEDGQRLRFPTSRLRPFLTQSGIYGRFQLVVTAENRFVELTKLS